MRAMISESDMDRWRKCLLRRTWCALRNPKLDEIPSNMKPHAFKHGMTSDDRDAGTVIEALKIPI